MARVLVADDDPVVRHVLKRLLTRSFRCVIDEAADGREAVDAVAKVHYQLVLLDLRMPVIDGLQALATIRAAARSAAVPVVVLTASRGDDIVRKALQMGISDYLVKPFTPATTERLARYLPKAS
jgi:CheY-like chemotaxis protein